MIDAHKGRYETLELIGSGSTSRVERAQDTIIGRTVVLKTFVNSFEASLEDQLLKEAQAIGQLSHQSIVQLYDVGINPLGRPFLVMEFVPGKTLEQTLAEPLPTAQRACAWAADLANALETAHSMGIVHGDVKPSNILLNQENKVKLGDFGIARFATKNPSNGKLMGTPAYLAPEQIRDDIQDSRSDQFSLGVVLYQMLTGKRPFTGDTIGEVCAEILTEEPVPPSEHNPAIPLGLDAVVMRCLAKNPEGRFPSCGDLAKALYPFCRSRDRGPARLPQQHTWWSAPTRQREVWLTLSACLTLVLLVQVPGFLKAHYGVPSLPSRSYFHPGVPYEAFSYSHQSVADAPSIDNSDAQPNGKRLPASDIQVQKITLADLNKPSVPRDRASESLVAADRSARAATSQFHSVPTTAKQ